MLQNFGITAGGRQIAAQASYFRLEAVGASGADESVKVRADGQDLGLYLPGDSIRLPAPATLWEVVPVTATATAMVRLGVAGVESSRMFGTVRVLDDARTRTLQDSAFSAGGRATGAADQVAHLSLSNPAGSGKRIVITQFGAYAYPSTGGVLISVHSVQAATMAGDAFVRNPASKRQSSGAAPIASASSVRSLLAATALPGATHVELMTVFGSSIQREIKLTEPVVIRPGASFTLRASGNTGGAIVDMTAWFEFTEESDA